MSEIDFIIRDFEINRKSSSRFIEEEFHGGRSFKLNKLTYLLFKRDEFDEDILQTVSVTHKNRHNRYTYKKYY